MASPLTEDEKAAELTRMCVRCCRDLPVTFFQKDAKGRDGRRASCRECRQASRDPAKHAEIQRRYVARNRDKVYAANRAWEKSIPDYDKMRTRRRWANPETRSVMLASKRRYRQRKRAGGEYIPLEMERRLLSTPCAYCGGKATELDHILPVSRGGRHTLDNLAPACRSCNARKNARTPEEWQKKAANG